MDLIAQIVPEGQAAPGWLAAGGVATCLSFVLWYAWYQTTHVGPRFDKRLDEKEAAHRKEREDDRDEFYAALERMTTKHENVISKVVDHCESQNKWLRTWKGLPGD